MCQSVCMYVSAPVHVCRHVCCICSCLCMCLQMSMYVSAYVHICVCKCSCMCLHLSMYVGMHIAIMPHLLSSHETHNTTYAHKFYPLSLAASLHLIKYCVLLHSYVGSHTCKLIHTYHTAILKYNTAT